MGSRRGLSRLYYFTVEDEGILAEAFPKFEQENYCIAYKVVETDDVFVTTGETKEAMDRHDVPYNLLADEEAGKIAILHSTQSKEELGDFDDPIRALVLANRGVAAVCVGVNGDAAVGALVAASPSEYSYFTALAGHTFLWRILLDRKSTIAFVKKLYAGDKKALEWAESTPLGSAKELKSFH